MKNNSRQKFYLLLTLTVIVGFLVLYCLFGLLLLTLNYKSFELFGFGITILVGATGGGSLWSGFVVLSILIVLFVYLIYCLYKLKKQKME